MRSQPFNGSLTSEALGLPSRSEISAGTGSTCVCVLFVLVCWSLGHHGPGVAAWGQDVFFSVVFV